MKTVFVTGGAGFIGSSLCRLLVRAGGYKVINIDCLTYAANLKTVSMLETSDNYVFEQVNICDAPKINALIQKYQPDGIFHLAAESHVDRSIDDASPFLQTNIIGTSVLLQSMTEYLRKNEKPDFRFLHISTDEVFGSLSDTGLFSETTAYDPSSPYSASKAASDHLVRAWHRTYGLPALITNCSNNYGPYQFPEKLIPLMINNALAGKNLPIYGNGSNVRDWLYVDDHARALKHVFENGLIGETYCVGGHNEQKNIDVVNIICETLDKLRPSSEGSYKRLISFVTDRLGHDQRYAIDASKIDKELGWTPEETFETGLEKTIAWYLENHDFWDV